MILPQIIGCQPSQSAVMAESVKAGQILDLPSDDTLSDGTAGGFSEENPVRIIAWLSHAHFDGVA